MQALSCVLVTLGLALSGCGEKRVEEKSGRDGNAETPSPLSREAEALSQRQVLFEKLPSKMTGVDFINPLDLSHPMKFLYHQGFACGGVAIGDLDGDGRPDLFFVGGPVGNKLYLQSDTFRFEDISAAVGIRSEERRVGKECRSRWSPYQ